MMDDDTSKTSRVITVHLRQPDEHHPQKWSTVERIIKILSALALPVILAVFGFSVQRRLQNQTLQRDYVSLAVSILQESDSQKASPELKQWAADLLNQNAPIKLPPQLLASLQSGGAVLPAGYTAV